METDIETSLKECTNKLKNAAITLALTHHKIKNVPELASITRDVADALADVSSLAIHIQEAITSS